MEKHQELFNYLDNELGAIALQSQLFEIETIVLKNQKKMFQTIVVLTAIDFIVGAFFGVTVTLLMITV